MVLPITVSPDRSLREVAALLGEHRISSVVVEDQGVFMGVVSERDIVRAVAMDNTAEITARSVMQPLKDQLFPDSPPSVSEQQFRSAIIETPYPIIIHAEDGEVLQINRMWTELTGYCHRDIPTISDWVNLAYGNDRTRVLQGIQQLYHLQSKTKEGEFEITTKYGTKRLWQFASAPLGKTPDGRKSVISIATDITDRKLAERALRKSEEQRRLALDLTNVGSWDFNTLTGEAIWSDTHYQLMGLSAGEVPSNYQTWRERVHPDDIKRVEADFSHALTHHSQLNVEYRIVYPDQTLRWVLTKGQGIYNLEGTAVRMTGVMMDITDRKEAELALVEQQKFITKIAESTLAIIYILTLKEKRHFFVNTAIESILGFTAAEVKILGDQFLDRLVHPDDLMRVMDSIGSLEKISDQDLIELEYRIQHQDSSYRWLLSRDRILHRDKQGKPTHVLGVAFDITKLKETESALFKMNQELEIRVADRTKALQQQAEQERLVTLIIQNIHRSFNLPEILSSVLPEVRTTFQADRVAVYQFLPDWSGYFLAESVAPPWTPVVGAEITQTWRDTYLQETAGGRYKYNQFLAVEDVYLEGYIPCHIEALEKIQARAYIIVPIIAGGVLWGLLATYQNSGPRTWKPWEINLLEKIGTQTAIAIQQTALNQNLKAQLAQRDILLKEIHHRVKNNLQIMSSLLRMQFRNSPQEIEAKIEEYQDRIQAMALVHDQLYRSDNFEYIYLQKYIFDLASYLFQTYSANPSDIDLFLSTQEITLPLDQAIPLGLIINELISNALKYAFPQAKGKITIELSKQGETMHLTVADNGIGIPPNRDIFNSETLGIQLVLNLTEQLQGKLTCTNCGGAVFDIYFPANSDQKSTNLSKTQQANS